MIERCEWIFTSPRFMSGGGIRRITTHCPSRSFFILSSFSFAFVFDTPGLLSWIIPRHRLRARQVSLLVFSHIYPDLALHHAVHLAHNADHCPLFLTLYPRIRLAANRFHIRRAASSSRHRQYLPIGQPLCASQCHHDHLRQHHNCCYTSSRSPCFIVV